MKVMLFVPEYPPYHIGGGGIVYENIALVLKRLGIDLVVVWGYFPTESIFERPKYYKKNGILFYKIPEIPYIKSLPYLRTAMPPNFHGILAVNQILNKEKPDIIHFHGYGLPFITFGCLLSIIYKIPYVFTVHGFPKSPEDNMIFHLFWNLYQKILMKIILSKSQVITCISKWLRKDERLALYQEKIKIIYNGINIDSYKKFQLLEENTIQKICNIPDKSDVLLSVGRISRMKGFQLVIDVLPRLNKKNRNCYYVIIGEDDGFKESLQSLARKKGVEDKVIFTGFISEKLKLNCIKQSDVYIVPSLWEPFGLTALEGLALEKIVLTTGAGGLKEFLSQSKNVMFFDKNNPESLYGNIIRIITNKKQFKNDNYIQKFDWEHVVSSYLEVYKDVIGEM